MLRMYARKLLFLHGIVLAFTVAAYLAGLEFFLFWRLWWFDVLLHFLGGAWAALASAWALALFGVRLSSARILGCALAIGIGWEVLEYVLDFPREEAYLLDLATDIVMDALGAVFAARVALSVRP